MPDYFPPRTVSGEDVTSAGKNILQYVEATGGTGTPNAYLIAPAYGFTPADGDRVWVRWNVTNTGAATLNGAPIYKSTNGGDLVGGELAYRTLLIYSGTSNAWYLASPWRFKPNDLGTGPGAGKFYDGLGAWRALTDADSPNLWHGVMGRLTADQAITAATATPIGWDSEAQNLGTRITHSTSTNNERFVSANNNQLVRVQFHVSWTLASGGTAFAISIVVGASSSQWSAYIPGTTGVQYSLTTPALVISQNQADYIRCNVYSYGAAATVKRLAANGDYGTYASVEWAGNKT